MQSRSAELSYVALCVEEHDAIVSGEQTRMAALPGLSSERTHRHRLDKECWKPESLLHHLQSRLADVPRQSERSPLRCNLPEGASVHCQRDLSLCDAPVGATYWRVKNGICLSGMPAYAEVLSEEQIAGVHAACSGSQTDVPCSPVGTRSN